MTLPSWSDPQEPKPAPQPLLLVQAFVNTLDVETGGDLLAAPAAAGPWLRDAGLVAAGAEPGPAALRRAREVREGLRALLARNGAGPPPAPGDLAPLEAVARARRPVLSIFPNGEVLVTPPPDGSLTGGLLTLLLVVRDAQLQGTWPRLKACRNPECGWAFYDRSHAHRGAWGEMARCGNVIKNRNFRARRGQHPAAPGKLSG